MQILRLPQVRQRVGLSRSQIYMLISQGLFPRQVPLGVRARGWSADEIQAWIAERVRERDANGPRSRS
jgi:prophage regulatory protein